MIGNIVKKIFFKKSDDKKKTQEQKKNLALSINEKSKQLSGEFKKKLDSMKDEFFVMKDKCDNLLDTNYKIGLKHIEKGNLSDAIFRFRFIKKFWPDHHDSLYQLSYCLILNKKPEEAKKILEELVAKNPQHQNGKELLEIINTNLHSEENLTT